MIRKQHARDKREAEKQKRHQERLQNALDGLAKDMGVSMKPEKTETTVTVRLDQGNSASLIRETGKQATAFSSANSEVRSPVKLQYARKKGKPASAGTGIDEAEAQVFLEYMNREKIRIPADKPVIRSKKERKVNPGIMSTLNLEQGMPLVEAALSRMEKGLTEARFSGMKAVRLIHGYGSTGRGGAICTGVRSELARMHRAGEIKDYIPGEEFGAFDHRSRRFADQYPEIVRDPDYGNQNHGITIVIL